MLSTPVAVQESTTVTDQVAVDRSLAAILTLNTIAHTVGAIGAGGLTKTEVSCSELVLIPTSSESTSGLYG